MTTEPRVGAVIVAAGSGVRFGDVSKALVGLRGRPLLSWSLDVFGSLDEIRSIVVVAGEHTIDRCKALIQDRGTTSATVVLGGATRAESVRAGLAALAPEISYVAVHDAARPLLTPALVRRVLMEAIEIGAAVPAIPVSDTLHAIGPDGLIAATPDRAGIRAAQTPQIARRDWLEDTYRTGAGTTDEGGLLAAAGYPVRLVDGDAENIKITWPADLVQAEAIMAARGGNQ